MNKMPNVSDGDSAKGENKAGREVECAGCEKKVILVGDI